ncbi:hypothetical protein [Corynebacterium suedekumii]|uniref:Uncharacterized protein n=1 Tax=Corynebacterium suedekumii TaxID=3049801 RepID=A0ABY8VL34_9CORY|nr:hypothetical protein [Corynebacterium suedekumii]WIM70213.1 hypothetical protein QP029_13760 [Corynebacterium suedekumii]
MEKRAINVNGPVVEYSSVVEFLSRNFTPTGLISIDQGLPLHLHWTDAGADTTLVMFSGATSTRIPTVPAFEGFATTRDLSANVLLVSDPSIILDRKMTIGWYAGHNRAPDFQQELQEIVASLAEGTRVVFFGTSGGGFPALEQASRVSGSTALVVNPLTHVNYERREAVDLYLKNAWNMENPEDPDEVPFVNSVIPIYEKPVDASVLCIHNINDTRHLKHYWNPFVKVAHPSNQICTIKPDLGPGHVGPDKKTMVELFRMVTVMPEFGNLVDCVTAMPITREV